MIFTNKPVILRVVGGNISSERYSAAKTEVAVIRVTGDGIQEQTQLNAARLSSASQLLFLRQWPVF